LPLQKNLKGLNITKKGRENPTFLIQIIATIQYLKFRVPKWLISFYFAFLSRQSSVGSRQSEDRTIYTFQDFVSCDYVFEQTDLEDFLI
jgi:hypothetical protein